MVWRMDSRVLSQTGASGRALKVELAVPPREGQFLFLDPAGQGGVVEVS